MKRVKYLAMMLAAGMFAACSDTLEDTGGGNAGGNTPSTTEGYVKVAINLPTTSGGMSRANDDQDQTPDIEFNDGIADEYKVTDGIIVFFKTTTEETAKDPDANATFVSAYKLDNLMVNNPNDDTGQVTERVATVTEAPMVNTKDKEALYALVILNPSDKLIVVDENAHTLKINGTNIEQTDKLEKFTTAISGENVILGNFIGDNKDAFTMSNAPLSTEDGGDNSYSNPAAKTLVPVTVYKTEAEAEANDAARIYVERVAAKVTLTGFDESVEIQEQGQAEKTYKSKSVTSTGVYNGDVVALEGWALNVTNKSTSLVRNVKGFIASTSEGSWLASATLPATNKTSRFAGTEVIPINYTGTNYYRIYWAEDGNYESSTPSSDFNTFYTNNENGTITNEPTWNTETADDATATDDHALYCLENTMTYTNQKNNQSTTVVLKTKYLTKFGSQSTATSQDFFICGSNPAKYPKPGLTDVGDDVTDIITYVKTAANDVLAAENKIGDDDLSLKSGDNVPAGIYDSVEDLKKLFELDNAGDDDTKWNAIWNQVGTIKYYKGGISYYYDDIYIRHFSDTETPWSDGESYGIQHLGRYGVVRNNWYEINISSITGPGEPSIDEPGDDNNDDAEGYIQAEINVLSWAKRSQSVDL